MRKHTVVVCIPKFEFIHSQMIDVFMKYKTAVIGQWPIHQYSALKMVNKRCWTGPCQTTIFLRFPVFLWLSNTAPCHLLWMETPNIFKSLNCFARPAHSMLIHNFIIVINQCNQEFLMEEKKKPWEKACNTLFLYYMLPFSLYLVYTVGCYSRYPKHSNISEIYRHWWLLISKAFWGTRACWQRGG